MAVITQIKCGGNPLTRQSGVDTLKALDRAGAEQLLTSLRSDLREKTGVVRLLHTSSANQAMKFKNAGAFKRMFLSGEKLQRSGEVIAQLLRSAGLSEAKATAFEAYVQKRAESGVQAQQVLKYIDMLRAETGATPGEALEKFGVSLNQQGRAEGRVLGHGAVGEAVVVRYRGEDYVYKQPLPDPDSPDSLESLKLIHTGPAGAEANAAPSKSRPSFEPYDPSATNKGLLNRDPPGLLAGKQDFDLDSSSNGSMRDVINPYFANFLISLDDLEVSEPKDEQPGQPSNRAKSPLDVQKPQAQPQLTVPVPSPIVEEEFQSQFVIRAEPAQPSKTPSTTKLARMGLGVAARVKDLPQVITPSVYVIRETPSDGGAIQYHAVAGQQRLKDWARAQQPGSKFAVTGLLMPKAKGQSPIEYPEAVRLEDPNPPPRLKVARGDLTALAKSSLELLKGLASHGFIHGDIKPENLIWDAKTKTLQVIDNDGLAKVSKMPGSQVEAQKTVYTITYANPVMFAPPYRGGDAPRVGLGRDLFSIGMVLLAARPAKRRR